MTTLRTDRLLLDAVTPADADAVFEYCNDPQLQGYLPVPVPYTRESAAAYVGDFAAAATHLWAIRAASGDLLGVIGLKPHEVRSAEIGYWLGAPHRGQGYMTEAAIAVIDHTFASDEFDHLEWCAVVGNVGSATVAQRAGFSYEGLRRRAMVHRSERVDGWYASLLRSDDRAPKGGWPL